MDGISGDIRLLGADCAEQFDIADCSNVEPGDVMVIHDYPCLQRSYKAYDRSVAGIVSDAGPYKPGIVLGTGDSGRRQVALALAGRTYCKVDADAAPVHRRATDDPLDG